MRDLRRGYGPVASKTSVRTPAILDREPRVEGAKSRLRWGGGGRRVCPRGACGSRPRSLAVGPTRIREVRSTGGARRDGDGGPEGRITGASSRARAGSADGRGGEDGSPGDWPAAAYPRKRCNRPRGKAWCLYGATVRRGRSAAGGRRCSHLNFRLGTPEMAGFAVSTNDRF